MTLVEGMPVRLVFGENRRPINATVLGKGRFRCLCGGDCFHVETDQGDRLICCADVIVPPLIN